MLPAGVDLLRYTGLALATDCKPLSSPGTVSAESLGPVPAAVVTLLSDCQSTEWLSARPSTNTRSNGRW